MKVKRAAARGAFIRILLCRVLDIAALSLPSAQGTLTIVYLENCHLDTTENEDRIIVVVARQRCARIAAFDAEPVGSTVRRGV